MVEHRSSRHTDPHSPSVRSRRTLLYLGFLGLKGPLDTLELGVSASAVGPWFDPQPNSITQCIDWQIH